MPIVDVEVVTGATDSEAISKEALQRLADQLGSLFGSELGGTWIRLRSIDQNAYAENRAAVGPGERPIFVNILRAEMPARAALRQEITKVAEIVARTLDRPRENVHVIYAPGASGRIGFGGVLVE